MTPKKRIHKKVAALEEKLEVAADLEESLNRTIAQLEAELASCEEERDGGGGK